MNIINKLTTAILFSSFLMLSCNNISEQHTTSDTENKDTLVVVPDHHNSRNSLDWAGKYEGTIPCADCPGMKVTLNLKANDSFTFHQVYIDRASTLTDSGVIMWHENGGVIHLKTSIINVHYKVGKMKLIGLDTEGNPLPDNIADQYQLTKVE